MNTNPPPELLSPAQVAQWLGFKPQTLAVWRTKGLGPPFLKIGHSVRYRRTDVEQFLLDNPNIKTEDESSPPDPRLDWQLLGFFILDGPLNATLQTRFLNYRLHQLHRDPTGRLLLPEPSGRTWVLVHDIHEAQKLWNILRF